MTKLSEARMIVPDQALWVAVKAEYWVTELADLDWNSALMGASIRPPVSAVKIGLLEEVLRVNKMCRPIEEYRNFNNQPIVVQKESKRKING